MDVLVPEPGDQECEGVAMSFGFSQASLDLIVEKRLHRNRSQIREHRIRDDFFVDCQFEQIGERLRGAGEVQSHCDFQPKDGLEKGDCREFVIISRKRNEFPRDAKERKTAPVEFTGFVQPVRFGVKKRCGQPHVFPSHIHVVSWVHVKIEKQKFDFCSL
ncbi:hypothetical protein [Stieleria tagensis]|uniref:hypothetical protein n=1 Tax=Stieleria tagensis TaxID=2956795 RepID=UPI00209BA085|nr:hypothetical protein [Stieleria tagensis]